MINKNKYILIGIGTIIVIAVIMFVINDFYKKDALLHNTKEITKNGISLVLSEDSSDVDIKQIPIDGMGDSFDIKDINGVGQALDYPELNDSTVLPISLSDDAKVIIASNIATLINKLEGNKDSFGDWLSLAAQYKIIEDYEGARDILVFLNASFTTNSTVLNNLGDLYHYNLKDFPKSEKSFKYAIEKSPNTQSYIGLHELYKYSHKQETNLVTDVLIEGIEETSTSIDLMTTLASYYKERGNMSKGDQTNAKKYYEQARDQAQNLGNTQLVEALNTELSNLNL